MRTTWFKTALIALLCGLALAALALFAIGIPWLAGLNPYYAPSDWTKDDTTVTDVTASIDARGPKATRLSAFHGLDGALQRSGW